ncbi:MULTISPECIES: hypothetical protein [unclassified Nocardiopsis]|uniref:hypothetical protein n=1 Tax=unclassified Nocardiopsis TaxID=2649073 RepID=UPI00066B7EEA|nr:MULTISPECIES: hypothetical protein [unclassified Nocardiopsis]
MRFTLGVLIRRVQDRNPKPSNDPATGIVELIAFATPTDEQQHRENFTLVEYRVMARTGPRDRGRSRGDVPGGDRGDPFPLDTRPSEGEAR